jgi:hypothetical protein
LGDPISDGVELRLILEVEDEERLGMRNRSWVIATGRQLELGARAGDLEEHAVVAGMIVKSAGLGETHLISIEADQLSKAVGVARDP